MPSHSWLLCKQSECLVGGNQKAVTNFGSGVLGKIECLVIKIRVRFWTKDTI